MSYASAQAYCKDLDRRAHLAEIWNQEIQELIEDLLDWQSYSFFWLVHYANWPKTREKSQSRV